MYRLDVYGNWCMGWHYAIVNPRTGYVLRDCGPNHNPNGRDQAEEDGRNWAFDHGVPLEN